MSDIIVVGAGLAGLVCAGDLRRAGVDCCVLEASDGVGGRVRTDAVDGYLLDRGFQVLLCGYPDVRARLDLARLRVHEFIPGARVRVGGSFHVVADPIRHPGSAWSTVRAPVGTVADKVRTLALVADVLRHSPRALLRRTDTTTAARLARAGFSEAMVESFWRPLFAGIQLDPDLEVSSRRFELVLRMLATGPVGVPERGMGAVAEQLGSGVPVRLGSPVEAVEGTSVVLRGGERLSARAVVVATDGPTAHRLLGSAVPDPGSRPVACCWFSAPAAPVPGPLLVLDGDRSGPATNVAVMSEVSRSYAPAGRALVAAAVPGADALSPGLTGRVREQLSRWWGAMTTDWEELRTDVIPHGQPQQLPPLHAKQRVDMGEGVFVCGDHRDTASTQGAMFSGGRAASAVLAWLHGPRHQWELPGAPLNGPTTHDVTQPP